MNLETVLGLLGIRPGPRRFGSRVDAFELPAEGRVELARWLHPRELPKTVSQAAVDELRTFLRPGDVAIDIGAHSGDTTVPMALAVGREGCVLAFEPNEYVFPVLEQNARLNPDRTRIVPLPFAAMESDGEYAFEYTDSGFCNGGRLEGISRWRHRHAFTLRVCGRNLMALLTRDYPELIDRVRYIKVDAEGDDLNVLTSLSVLIARNRPYLRAEVYRWTAREQREAFHAFLTRHGYDVFRLESESHYRGERLGPECMSGVPHFDIFCVPAALGTPEAGA